MIICLHANRLQLSNGKPNRIDFLNFFGVFGLKVLTFLKFMLYYI